MCENMDKREAELNEQALSGVSGGRYDIAHAIRDAAAMCSACYTGKPSKRDCFREHMEDLAGLLEKNGPNSIHHFRECPYYKS